MGLLTLATAVSWLCGVVGGAEFHDVAVLTSSTSRMWLNYRHIVDEAVVNQLASAHGASGASVASLSADPLAADLSSSIAPGQLFGQYPKSDDLLARATKSHATAHGSRATAQALLRLLSGRSVGPTGQKLSFAASTGGWGPPRNARRESARRNYTRGLLVYLHGHGGEGFLKVHDSAALASEDVAWALAELRLRLLLAEDPSGSLLTHRATMRSLLVLDTCQAGSLWEPLPPALGPVWATSPTGKSSYARGSDGAMGVALSDGFAGVTHGVVAASADAGLRAEEKALYQLLLTNQGHHGESGESGESGGGVRRRSGLAKRSRSEEQQETRVHPWEAAVSATASLGDWRARLTPSSMLSELVVRPTGVNADGHGRPRVAAGRSTAVEAWLARWSDGERHEVVDAVSEGDWMGLLGLAWRVRRAVEGVGAWLEATVKDVVFEAQVDGFAASGLSPSTSLSSAAGAALRSDDEALLGHLLRSRPATTVQRGACVQHGRGVAASERSWTSSAGKPTASPRGSSDPAVEAASVAVERVAVERVAVERLAAPRLTLWLVALLGVCFLLVL